MKFDVINRSIVVVGKEYFPASITHEFLRNSRIVKRTWEQSEVPIMNPLLSMVKYTNGIVFAIERNKLQVVDNVPPTAEYRIVDLSEKLIQKVANVRYTAVGVNIAALSEHSNPGKYILEKFIRPGPWTDTKPEAAAVSYIYSFKLATLTITCEQGAYLIDKQQRDGVLLTSNYNINISADLSLEAAQKKTLEILEDYKTYHDHFTNLLNIFFSEDSEHGS